jgi:hypothetical protein
MSLVPYILDAPDTADRTDKPNYKSHNQFFNKYLIFIILSPHQPQARQGRMS